MKQGFTILALSVAALFLSQNLRADTIKGCVVDAETGHEQYVDTSSRAVRRQVRQWWADSQRHWEELFKRSGAGYAAIATNGDFVKPLMNLFARRG